MSTMTLPALELRPPRVNAAGVCVRCLTRCHDDPQCVAWFASSCWMVCPLCDGTNWIETPSGDSVACGCWSGLMEACHPTYLEPEPPAATAMGAVAAPVPSSGTSVASGRVLTLVASA